MLDKPSIERLFERLNGELASENIHGEIFLVGGAAMCLAYAARGSTKDIDAFFRPARRVREAAARVATREGIDSDWLNDAVKGYLSEKGSFAKYLDLSHLQVSVANPDYLLAMKCLAMRLGEEFQDLNDVRFLLRLLGIQSYDRALGILAGYYPLDKFPQKTLYVLEELLAED